MTQRARDDGSRAQSDYFGAVLGRVRSLPKEARNLLAGGLAGMLAKSAVAPVDRIKILYQVTSATFHLRDVPRVALSIVEKEGLSALWKGNTATMIRVFPYSGIQFMVFDYCKVYFLGEKAKRNRDGTSNVVEVRRRTDAGVIVKKSTILRPTDSSRTLDRKAGLTPLESLVSGMFAGTVSVLCTYPLDLARAQLAVLRKRKRPKAADAAAAAESATATAKATVDAKGCPKAKLDGKLGIGQSSAVSSDRGIAYVLRSGFRQHGLAGIYRGITPTVLGILPYSGMAFTINEQAKRQVSHVTGRDPTTVEKLQCGALSGLLAQTLAYPLEVTRRRMQTIGIVPTSGEGSAAVNFAGVSTVRPSVDALAEETAAAAAAASSSSGAASSSSAAPPSGPRGPLAGPARPAADHAPPTMITTMRHLFAEQGTLGFYKGVSMNWIKGPVAFSISFTAFDTLQRLVETDEEKWDRHSGAKRRGSSGRVSDEQMIQRRITNNDD